MKFTMWSFGHILFMFSPFILAFVLYLFSRKKEKNQQYRLGLYLSVFAIVILFARNIEIFIKDGYKFSAELIPLQICHFANFVLLVAFWKKSKSMFALSFCLNLPAAFLSIVFANSLENYQTLINFRGIAYIFGHMLIVGISLWAVFIRLIEIDRKTLLKTIQLMMILYLASIVVNNLLISLDLTPNYFYTIKPESGTPLEMFYEIGKTFYFGSFQINPVYLVLTAIFGLIVVVVFYGIFKLMTMRKN